MFGKKRKEKKQNEQTFGDISGISPVKQLGILYTDRSICIKNIDNINNKYPMGTSKMTGDSLVTLLKGHIKEWHTGNNWAFTMNLSLFESDCIYKFLLDSNKHKLSLINKRINELENNDFSNIAEPILEYKINK